jgi:hypothetical protein
MQTVNKLKLAQQPSLLNLLIFAHAAQFIEFLDFWLPGRLFH